MLLLLREKKSSSNALKSFANTCPNYRNTDTK
jgi:hypothetical protein